MERCLCDEAVRPRVRTPIRFGAVKRPVNKRLELETPFLYTYNFVCW